VTRACGPFTLSINEETGLLVEGFDAPPMLLMGHDPAYAGAPARGAGISQEKDVYAYLLDMEAPLSRSAHGMLERPLPGSVTMRRLNLSDYANEIRRMVDIYKRRVERQLGVRAPDGARGRRDGQATAGAAR